MRSHPFKIILLRRRFVVCLAAIAAAAAVFTAVAFPAAVTAGTTKRQLPIYSVECCQNLCAISFDAAWGNEDTQQLIDILARYDVKTTFFVVGEWVDKYPESVKALHDAGHEVMNHSNHHDHYNSLTAAEIIADITADDVVTVLGIYGDWVKVNVAGVEGYVYIDDVEDLKNVVGLPEEEAPETDDPTKNFKVTVFSNRRRVMELGETITLTSKIEGFEGFDTLLQWQCDKGNGFEDVAGANSDTHSFSASVESLAYDWRLIVYYR